MSVEEAVRYDEDYDSNSPQEILYSLPENRNQRKTGVELSRRHHERGRINAKTAVMWKDGRER